MCLWNRFNGALLFYVGCVCDGYNVLYDGLPFLILVVLTLVALVAFHVTTLIAVLSVEFVPLVQEYVMQTCEKQVVL